MYACFLSNLPASPLYMSWSALLEQNPEIYIIIKKAHCENIIKETYCGKIFQRSKIKYQMFVLDPF